MPFFARESEVHCKHDYFEIWAGGVSFKTVALTLIIIVLTFAIEAAVHSETKQPAHDESSRVEDTLATDASPSSDQSDATETKAKSTRVWCNPNPSPSIRAHRLAHATILMIPLCIAFGFRIAGIAPPDVRDGCREILKPYMQTAWWAIIPLNIIPFILASVAWIRAFVDCLLVRWGKTVGYLMEGEEFRFGWPPCAPLFWVLIVALVPVMGLCALVKKSAVWIMGSPDVEGNATGDLELGGEERIRLVDDFDGAGSGEDEEPPAYDTNWRENEVTAKTSS
ncbi:hypothetical protein K505DRAFT_327389 [Melanomma pulvis-pyrius CBS 109.77]|uniref:Uncharacterized protein n=1 Tax=Melanomma pulvis-pyrius CBS 109.77 TaxID=1314802 RepID=A0A6A6X2G2_9PLEO|nr:hypothetical protein K505DRAFT_327389 [Melanomma pulvis-pyrius CBS 109.77]